MLGRNFRMVPEPAPIYSLAEQIRIPISLWREGVRLVQAAQNIERLIDAFGRAREGGPEHLKLIIIGNELSKYPTLRQAVHRYKLDKQVRVLGFQPHETLAAFYRLARAFVFPSLYEGVRPAAA